MSLFSTIVSTMIANLYAKDRMGGRLGENNRRRKVQAFWESFTELLQNSYHFRRRVMGGEREREKERKRVGENDRVQAL